MTIKQFKLVNDDEIICEVVQWDDLENAAMVIRGAMRINFVEDYHRGVRFYAFRPWMGLQDDPEILMTLNSVHIIGEINPSEDMIGHYTTTLLKLKSSKKKNMPLDDIATRAEDMDEKEFQIYLDEYLKDKEVDIFNPDDLSLDLDSSETNNIIKFKPKGTMH